MNQSKEDIWNVIGALLFVAFIVWVIWAGFSDSGASPAPAYPYQDYNNEAEVGATEYTEPLFKHSEPLFFNGYECTDDCSGHEAGYEWAENNGIDDVDDCSGNSDSFIEGCVSYVEENY